MRGIRTLRRYIRDAAKSVIRNFSLSLASISCIAITLIVVAFSIVLSYNVGVAMISLITILHLQESLLIIFFSV